jgi:hypothetical protein
MDISSVGQSLKVGPDRGDPRLSASQGALRLQCQGALDQPLAACAHRNVEEGRADRARGRRGAVTALITIEGFRDAVETGYEHWVVRAAYSSVN